MKNPSLEFKIMRFKPLKNPIKKSIGPIFVYILANTGYVLEFIGNIRIKILPQYLVIYILSIFLQC